MLHIDDENSDDGVDDIYDVVAVVLASAGSENVVIGGVANSNEQQQ